MSDLGPLVRRHDPDRYFAALFAPAALRPVLFALYAFNHELARAHEAAREPGLALIRLQWWREVVEGADRRHEVATPLRDAMSSGALPAPPLLSMIEAREAGIEPPATLVAFGALMRAGPGALAAAAGAALGGADHVERLTELGAAIGVLGTLRNVQALALRQRCQLPADVLAAAGLTPEAACAEPAAAVQAAGPALRAQAAAWLGRPTRFRRRIVAAALPAVFARRDLRHGPPPGPRGAADRFALLLAAVRSTV